MRVLILAEFLAQLGGCENLCCHVAAGLAAAGDEVLVTDVGAQVHPHWRALLSAVSYRALDPADPVGALVSLISSWRPDVVHAVPYERVAFQLLEAGCPVPVIGTEPCDGSLRCGWWYSGEPLRRALPRFAALHLVSGRARTNLRADYGWDGIAEVIPPPATFPADLPLWERPEPSFRLLLQGRMATEKGFEMAIGSLRRLREEVAPIGLDLWGDGPLRESLERLATVAGVSPWVRFRAAYGSLAEIPFRDYDALLMPSWFEGLPYVFLEGLWSGIPPIVSTSGGMRDLPGAEVVVGFFDPGHQETLVEALRTHYAPGERDATAPARRRRLVQEHCAPAVVIPRYRELYRRAYLERAVDISTAGAGTSCSQ